MKLLKKTTYLFSTLLLVVLMFQSNIKAQSNDECLQQVSIFAEYAKVKNYNAALSPWREARKNCPSANAAIYSYGERILQQLIENSEGQEKDQHIEDLISLYDQWVEYFPERKGVSEVGGIMGKKAQALLDYEVVETKTIYLSFKEAYESDPNSFTNPKHIYNYFKSLHDLFKQKNPLVSEELLFEVYEDLSEKFVKEGDNYSKRLDELINKEDQATALSNVEQRNKKAFGSYINAFSIFHSNMDKIIAREASCENLIPFYQRNLDENKGDLIWVKRATSRMYTKDCTDSDLFVTLVETMHQLEPSADSAYFLGYLTDKSGNTQEALKYYQEAIELEDDAYKRATILYRLGLEFKKANNYSAARNYFQRALKDRPSLGKAYLAIANMYASSANNCGETQFEKRAIYWLAADEARKAARVDPSVKQDSNKFIESYMGRAPSKTDIFTEGMEGQTVTFNCWVGRTITVPSLSK
ncbi:MAG: tetratricopeptide repeat protein [Flavobacteriaceae bacterium]|nr:tetratricopeptide repeat protein [Flavobacteriaceae bacterium]